MLRVLVGAVRRIVPSQNLQLAKTIITIHPTSQIEPQRSFSLIHNSLNPHNKLSLLSNPKIIEISNNIQNRTLTKFSLGKGKRKTVKSVLKRFYRLNWGIWIRTKCGRGKKLYKKTSNRKRRLRQHVFCNATQSTLLDKMVNKYWKKPRYYVDDPYEPYHLREEFQFSRRKPKPYIPKEQ